MKKLTNRISMYITIAALLFVFAFKAHAQDAEGKVGEFGIRFMPTFTALKMNTSAGGTIQGQMTLGFGFGAFLGINFTDHVGVQGEVIYTSLTQEITDKDITQKVSLSYINIPLLLSLNTGKSKAVNFNVVAGPQIGLSTGSSVSSSGGDGTATTTAVIAVKKGDLGFAYGAGLDFGVNSSRTIRLGFGFRGVFGFFDISDDNHTNSTDKYYILDKSSLKTYSGYLGVSFLF